MAVTRLLTGAGDLYASGFLYGLTEGWSTQRCAQLGCLAGGAVVQALGAEMTRSTWRWLFARYGLLYFG